MPVAGTRSIVTVTVTGHLRSPVRLEASVLPGPGGVTARPSALMGRTSSTVTEDIELEGHECNMMKITDLKYKENKCASSITKCVRSVYRCVL